MLSKVDDVIGSSVSARATAWHLQQSSASASVGARNDANANPNPNPTKIDVQLEQKIVLEVTRVRFKLESKALQLISVSWPSRMLLITFMYPSND